MKKYTSPLLLLLAAAIWGFAFSAQKSAETVPPLTLNAIRSFIATLFLLVIIPIFDKLRHTGRHLVSKSRPLDFSRQELIGGLICGAILAAATFFQQSGMAAGTDAGKVSFITAIYVVLVPIYSLPLGKRAAANVWVSALIAAVGFYFLCIDGAFTFAISDLIVLVCALIFPFHILAIDYFIPKCDGVRMSCIQFFTCGVLSAVFAIFIDGPLDFALVGESIMLILFLGIMSSGVAYTLQIIGQKGTGPTASAIILSLESVFGVLGAALALGERMNTREYIGSAIVLVAVILSQLNFKKKGENGKEK